MVVEAAAEKANKGLLRRAAEWVVTNVLKVVSAVIVAVATPIGINWVTHEDNKADKGAAEAAAKDSPVAPVVSQPLRQPDLGIRIEVQGDTVETRRIAQDAEQDVRARLNVPVAAAKVAVAYRLSGLVLGNGATRRVSVQWIVALPGQTPARCGPRESSFYSGDTLADAIAGSLNESIAVSAREGKNLCA